MRGGAFGGVVYSGGLGGALQFDYAAVVPGKWNHIVARSFHTFFYRGLSSASNDESWLFEADEGENQNRVNYYGNLFAGYKIPLIVNLAGVLIEAERKITNRGNDDLWGGNLTRWTVSPMIGAQFKPKLSANMLIQFRSTRNFTDETEDYGFYKDRRIQKDEPQRLSFYRVAAGLSLQL